MNVPKPHPPVGYMAKKPEVKQEKKPFVPKPHLTSKPFKNLKKDLEGDK